MFGYYEDLFLFVKNKNFCKKLFFIFMLFLFYVRNEEEVIVDIVK